MDLAVPGTSSLVQMNSDKKIPVKVEAIPQKEVKSEDLSFKDWKKQKEAALCKKEQTPTCTQLSKKTRNVRNNSHSRQQQPAPQQIGNIFCHNNAAWMQVPCHNFNSYGCFNNSNCSIPPLLPPPPILFGGANKQHTWASQQFFIGGQSNAFINQLDNHSMREGNCPKLRGTRVKSEPIEEASKTKGNQKTAHSIKSARVKSESIEETSKTKGNKKTPHSTISSNPLQKANHATIAKKYKQKINTSGASQSSVGLKIGPPKGLGSGGSWVPKPLWPPHNAEVPETKEEKQRIWKEYRQAMKPFKNREFANAKRTIQRLSKKPKEELDEKEVARMQQAEEIIANYKAILAEKHGPNWTLKIPGNNAPTAISNGQNTGEEAIKSTPAQIYVRKATSPPPWFKNNAGLGSKSVSNRGYDVLHNTFVFPTRTS